MKPKPLDEMILAQRERGGNPLTFGVFGDSEPLPLGNPQPFHFGNQCSPRQTQLGCGAISSCDHPSDRFQGLQQQSTFGVLQLAREARDGPHFCPVEGIVEYPIVGQDYRAFDQALKFTDVPRP